jgi:uncharacterized protein YacL
MATTRYKIKHFDVMSVAKIGAIGGLIGGIIYGVVIGLVLSAFRTAPYGLGPYTGMTPIFFLIIMVILGLIGGSLQVQSMHLCIMLLPLSLVQSKSI